MKPTTEILARISQNSLANKEEVFTKLYRYLLRPDIYFVAYKNLYANNGAATKGVNEDMLTPLTKNEIAEQMRVAYEYFLYENKDVTFSFPVLILVGDKDQTGKVKNYCKKWSKDTGYPLHYIKKAKHLSNCDNPEQVNAEIEMFITRNIYKMDF